MEKLINVFDIGIIFISVISCFTIITVYFYQRKSVLGRLISMGVAPTKIWLLTFVEYAIILVISSLCACATTYGGMYLFEALIKGSSEIPYIHPDIRQTIIIFVKTILINIIVLFVSTLYLAWRIMRCDGAQIVRDDLSGSVFRRED